MTFSEARREFQVRFYLWAASEWRNEIDLSFSNLRLFKSGIVWEVSQFITQLNRTQQLTLIDGLLRRNFCNVVQDLGDKCSQSDELLLLQCDNIFRIKGLYRHVLRLKREGKAAEALTVFQMCRPDFEKFIGEIYVDDDNAILSKIEPIVASIPQTFEEQIAARRAAGEKISFASRKMLRKQMLGKFRSTFKNQRILDWQLNDPEPHFETSIGGWIVSTNFHFGRDDAVIEYSHDIFSENMFLFPATKGTYSKCLSMQQNISFCSWLGVGPTEWEYLTNDEVESACDYAIIFIRRFFDVAPKLLKGLEVDKVTAGIH